MNLSKAIRIDLSRAFNRNWAKKHISILRLYAKVLFFNYAKTEIIEEKYFKKISNKTFEKFILYYIKQAIDLNFV